MGRLYELAADPLADGLSWAVDGLVDLRMCRVDDWRIFYVVDAQAGAVNVLALRALGRERRAS